MPLFWNSHTLLIYVQIDLSPFTIVIDVVQTTGSLLRHPTHEITRIIIDLSTVKSSRVVPGTIQLLTPEHHRQVKIPMGEAIFDATSCVIDPSPFRGPEALDAAIASNSTIQPSSGSSPVISKAEQALALQSSSSHTRRLMFRNSRRPYPPIQLLAQRWEAEPSGFALPRYRGDFASTSGRHQSNGINLGFEGSNQLALCRTLGASTDSGIYQRATADDLSSVIGFLENTCSVVAPRAASPSVIAFSHWSPTTQSNGELKAFPCHISSLSQSDQYGSSTITFPSWQSPMHEPATPLCDTVGHADCQSVPHIQQSLFFQQNRQIEPVPIGVPDISFYLSPSESATDLSYHAISRIVHTSTTPLHRRSNASAR